MMYGPAASAVLVIERGSVRRQRSNTLDYWLLDAGSGTVVLATLLLELLLLLRWSREGRRRGGLNHLLLLMLLLLVVERFRRRRSRCLRLLRLCAKGPLCDFGNERREQNGVSEVKSCELERNKRSH